MREITETHIIELIKKYAKGGGGLFEYFVPLDINLCVTIGTNLVAKEMRCRLEQKSEGSSSYAYVANFADVFAESGSPADQITAGTTFSIIFPYIRSDVDTSMYPCCYFGESGVGTLQIPPKHMSWALPDGTTKSEIGSLMRFNDPFMYGTNDLLARLAGGYNPTHEELGIEETIEDYMAISTTYPEIEITIDGTPYKAGTGSSSGIRAVKYTFRILDTLTLVDDEDIPKRYGIYQVGNSKIDTRVYV